MVKLTLGDNLLVNVYNRTNYKYFKIMLDLLGIENILIKFIHLLWGSLFDTVLSLINLGNYVKTIIFVYIGHIS